MNKVNFAVNISLKIMIFQHVENFGLDPDPVPDRHQNEKSDQHETPTSLVYRG
jgi:hypothetical protein